MKILARIEKSKSSWFLIFIAFLFFLLRLPSLFEPIWYGDEGIYQAVGMAMREGKILYAQTWDNKTPLLYAVYAFFSSDQFGVRFASLLTGLLSVFLFFLLAKRLFTHTKTVFFTTGVYAVFFGLPLLEGNIANSENFMLFFILLAGYLVVKTTPKAEPMLLLAAGASLSIAFLFKIVGIFDFAAFLFFLAISSYTSLAKLRLLVSKAFPFIIAFISPILLTILFFLTQNALDEFFSAAFKQNVGYVGYGNTFFIPQGFLILKLLLLAIFLLIVFLYRKLLSQSSLFILTWFAFSLFNAFFAQRPYTHYLLVLLPSIVLLVGLISFERVTEKNVTLYRERFLRNAATMGAIASLFFIGINFRVYIKTFLYYQNFLSFLTHKSTVTTYQAFFDRNTPRDYELSHYLKNHLLSNDTIFVWGNNAQLYKLVEKAPPTKYTVVYHINASKGSMLEVQTELDRIKPRFIVVISKDPLFPKTAHYREKIIIKDAIVYERIN
ncbi:MAG: glycosyltransferase family 39 protein [Candidatus Levybacteria bacterium]|nr:glycosyltransferase family 39 protein [Candidatus Levybacteria bacterium]